MNAPAKELRLRTQQFAVRIVLLCDTLPRSGKGRLVSAQLLRCGTSVGAQYAEAYRARSHPDFISKIESVTQELEETLFWIELIVDLEMMRSSRLDSLRNEIDQLMAIFVAMVTRARRQMKH